MRLSDIWLSHNFWRGMLVGSILVRVIGLGWGFFALLLPVAVVTAAIDQAATKRKALREFPTARIAEAPQRRLDRGLCRHGKEIPGPRPTVMDCPDIACAPEEALRG